MKAYLKSLAIVALLAMAACKTPEEMKAAQDAKEIAECKSMGVKKGTKEMTDCRLKLRSIAAQEEQARQASWAAFQQMQANQQLQQINNQQIMQSHDQIWQMNMGNRTYSCNNFGGGVNCF